MKDSSGLVAVIGLVVGLLMGVGATVLFRPQVVRNGIPEHQCKATVVKYQKETAAKAEALCNKKIKALVQGMPDGCVSDGEG